MPWESGERRHQSDDDDLDDGPETNLLDNPCEGHDGGESTLEQCLREYEETLTDHPDDDEWGQGEPVLGATEPAGDTEETTLNSLNEDCPQETGAATHEGGRGDDLIALSLGEYEETMDPLSSGRETTSEVEEHGVHLEEGATSQKVETVEQGERTGEPSTSAESAQNVSESPTEDQQSSSRNEVEVGERQGESRERSEEHIPLRLSDDPEAFAVKNSENLVELGILPEWDEVKLGDNTFLSFDAFEGLTVTHENLRYEITTVEHERIGELDFFSYKTEQGEEFLHIPEQDKVVPPYETTWYALPSNTEVYLDREYKHELLEAAIDKAGGQTALRDELHERGTEITDTYLYRHLHDLRDGMQADRLISILDYAGRDLDELNDHITAIGHCRAIEDPNIPFDLNNENGARIMAARYSDGTNCAPEGRGPRFDYANNDAEQRNRIIESIQNVFGGANILEREHDNGEVGMVRTSTDIIGYTLERSGAITGSITEQNPDIPTWIQQGNTELKHEWLLQAFGDEGSTWPQRGLATLTRCVDATDTLTDEQRNELDSLSDGWTRKPPAKGWEGDTSGYCRFADLPDDVQNSLELKHPAILDTEGRILHEDFGINNKIYATEVYEREDGYGVTWVLQTCSREDTRQFYDQIGFPQERKQYALARTLRIAGDDED